METFNFEHELLCIQEKLLNFAIALTHNPTYAWDLVQETNVKILENRNKFESHYYPIKIGYTFINLKSATIIQYTIKGRFMSR